MVTDLKSLWPMGKVWYWDKHVTNLIYKASVFQINQPCILWLHFISVKFCTTSTNRYGSTKICWISNMEPLGNDFNLQNTVECRYKAVQYNKILYTSLQWRGHSINQEIETTKDTPYLALTGELAMVCLLQEFWINFGVIMAPHYISKCNMYVDHSIVNFMLMTIHKMNAHNLHQ